MYKKPGLVSIHEKLFRLLMHIFKRYKPSNHVPETSTNKL